MFQCIKHDAGNLDDYDTFNGKVKKEEPVVPDSHITQDMVWSEAHKDAIRTVQLINVADKLLILTAGWDKMVHLWDFNPDEELQQDVKPLCTLKQGYMMCEYQWHFPIPDAQEGQKKVEAILEQTKRDREDKTKNPYYSAWTQSTAKRMEAQKDIAPSDFDGNKRIHSLKSPSAFTSGGQMGYTDNSAFKE